MIFLNLKKIFFLAVITIISFPLSADDGSKLWLHFDNISDDAFPRKVISNHKSATVSIAIRELNEYWKGQDVELKINEKSKHLKDGYRITDKGNKIVVESSKDIGLLYGTYHLLRLQSTNRDALKNIDIAETPSYDIRILNHWDNLDGTIERGYAGYSLWKWDQLPNQLSPRYEEYARANASLGINSTVLNNVNASPDVLKEEYLEKIKALADIFRPYGLKVYLSVNFSSPMILGGTHNSDPMNLEVRQWWAQKAKEIYNLIPNFGGFLVKANSEGQPGPQDYGRTHAEGANMLAEVLKPYKGIVMWRAFVYNPSDEDRAKQAYLEFAPLDGQFLDNVVIQIKNGPIDFQPREPFNPLFGALNKSAGMVEFQITQEYLGFSNHLAYLAPLFKETLDSDTYSLGQGSTIAKLTDGSLRPSKYTAISAVANIGADANWCGHHFAQSNWYAFGRLAWDNTLSSEQIADEWIKMTFTDDQKFVDVVKDMMLTSREAVVDYMMPLGLHHIFAYGHHYGPEPWCDVEGAREDWLPRYYHRADEAGLGFDRTTHGSNAVSQYCSPLDSTFNNLETCPENLILWFHHVAWNYKMKNNSTMWDELCYRYDSGVQRVRDYQKTWDKLEGYIDKERFEDVQTKLKIQARDAVWWKDACLLYFQNYSNRPIPYDIERPVHELLELKKIKLDMKHHN